MFFVRSLRHFFESYDTKSTLMDAYLVEILYFVVRVHVWLSFAKVQINEKYKHYLLQQLKQLSNLFKYFFYNSS